MMSKKIYDQITKKFWRNNRRCADLLNGIYFHGKQVIKPENVNVFDSEKSTLFHSLDKIQGIERKGDLIKIVNVDQMFVLFSIENQQSIDQSMIIRMLGYNFLDYLNQYDTNDGKKIYAVFPVVMYYGEEKWSSSTKLSEMVEVPQDLKDEFNDWEYKLIDVKGVDVNDFEDQQVVEFFQGIQDLYRIKRNEKVEMKELDVEVAIALAIFSHCEELIQYYKEEGGRVNMCQALNDYVNGAREESRSEGIMIGKSEGILIGKNEGIMIGRNEGIEEEKKNIVVRMLNSGLFTYEQIEIGTGVTMENIHEIALSQG